MTSLEKWRSLTQPTEVVDFFRGLFERVGVRVTDTNEQFTARHADTKVELDPALDPAAVNYVVDIQSEQVDRLAESVRGGALDEAQQYRIVSALFTPATAAMLKHPVFTNPCLRVMAGVEKVLHVRLLPTPATAPEAQHTLTYVNGQWQVQPGLHGTPQRTFKLTLADALAYHKRAFATLKANNLIEWIKFSTWYRKWRKGVSVKGAG